MNLVRLGHYHTPLGDIALKAESGDCTTALVVHVWRDDLVNLAVFDHEGVSVQSRTSVTVLVPDLERDAADPEVPQDSFHLSADCPWKR